MAPMPMTGVRTATAPAGILGGMTRDRVPDVAAADRPGADRMLDLAGVLRVAAMRRSSRLDRRIADVLGNRQAAAVVAAVPPPPRQHAHRGGPRVVGHGGGLRDRVRLDAEQAGPAAENGLDHGLLRRPLHTADLDDRGLDRRVAAAVTLSHGGPPTLGVSQVYP